MAGHVPSLRGALAVPPLLDAAGVLHVEPRLVVMPDDPRLGEYRSEFAGMPGQIEERPNEGPDETPGSRARSGSSAWNACWSGWTRIRSRSSPSASI